MKKIVILICLILFSFNNASAVTLYDALNQTYQNNIQLNAERENLKASEEDVNISKADFKPSLTLSGSKSKEDTNKNCKVELEKELHTRLTIKPNDSTELGNTLHQLLYLKDRTYFKNSVEKSETLEELGVDKTMFIAQKLYEGVGLANNSHSNTPCRSTP